MDDTAVEEHDQALLEHLQSAPGEWYAIHTFAGHEKKTALNIKVSALNNGLDDVIHQIEVPTEQVWEIRGGERRKVTRVKLPGYILIRMDMQNSMAWNIVQSTQGVVGFINHSGTPVSISTHEVFEMLRTPPPAEAVAEPEPIAGDHSIGNSVRIISGPFESLTATITDVNHVTHRVTASVELFGRDTPVELEFDQIQQI